MSWGDKGVKVNEDIGFIVMGMLIRWKIRITQGFCKSLKRISSEWIGLIKVGGVNVIKNWYEWDEDTR